MKLDAKTLLGTFLLILIPALLVGLGYWGGRYTCSLAFRQQLDGRSRADVLGSLVSKTMQEKVALAYFDPSAALSNMDNISWAVPCIPAPFVGHAPMPGEHGNATINSSQFRYEGEVVIPKPTSTFRIFLTGGSTAYGSGAPSQESTTAGFLSQLLSENLTPVTGLRYEVITGANPAWASTHERIFIENRLSELEPDMVISYSGNNDVHWGEAGRNVLWFRSYDDEIYLTLIRRIYAISGYPRIPEITEVAARGIPPTLVAERLMKNVRLSSYVLGMTGIDYVFVLQPTLAVTAKKLTAREREALVLNEVVKRTANRQLYFQESYGLLNAALSAFTADNFTYINLSTIFDDSSADEEIFLDSYHFGDRGNTQIAEAIYLQIKELLMP